MRGFCGLDGPGPDTRFGGCDGRRWQDGHRRGRPRLAGAEEGRAILDRFAALSRPFGTEFANEARSVRLG